MGPLMKILPCLFILLIFGAVACQDKPLAPIDSPEAYVGVWKVTGPKGQTYYMTIREDGSGSTTRGEGEFGTWKITSEQLEAKWIPKNLQIHFSSGSAKVPKIPSSDKPSSQKSIAEKVDKIPD